MPRPKVIKRDQIYCGDCLQIMQRMCSDSIDLTITSPPYDNLRDYHGYVFDFEGIAQELYEITKEGGLVVWVVADATVNGSETGTSFQQALYFKEIGFRLHDTMIWLKEQLPFPSLVRYYNAFEYMFVFSKGKPKTFNPLKDRRNASAGRKRVGKVRREYSVRWNYWLIHNQKRGLEPDVSAPFPERLANDHILSWSNPGDLILDPMCGSGTTCKMAQLNGRHFIGIDISAEYCEISRRRISGGPNDQTKEVSNDLSIAAMVGRNSGLCPANDVRSVRQV